MRLVKIALGSVNSTVGSVRSNVDRCLRTAREMVEADATVGALRNVSQAALHRGQSRLKT